MNYVTISGNIGVGKTTLSENLQTINPQIQINREDMNNPFIPLFYEDMKSNSMAMQMWFLKSRYHTMSNNDGFFIQDRCISEEACIFAKNMYQTGLMSENEYNMYIDFYNMINSFIPPPKLTIYLSASTEVLMKRIKMRGRPYEQQVSYHYIDSLNKLYEQWAKNLSGFDNFIHLDTEKNTLTNPEQLKAIYYKYLKPLI